MKAFSALVVTMVLLTFPSYTAAGEPAAITKRIEALVAEAHAATLTDPNKAIEKAAIIRSLADGATGRARTIGLATSEWIVAEAYLRLNQPKTAAAVIASAEARLSRIDDGSKLRGDVLVTLGWEAMQTGRAAQALAYYQEAHAVFQRDHEDRSRSRALVAIAILYDEAFDYVNSLKYYNQAREAAADDRALSLTIDGNSGQTLKDMRRFPEALERTRRALTIARAINNPVIIGRILRNQARIELSMNALGAADNRH